MDSGDDMYYPSDEEEELYCSEEEAIMDSYDDGDDDDDDADGDDKPSQREVSYTVLSEDDIRRQQEEDIRKISTVLSISRFSACILLCHYNWKVTNLEEAWFGDEEKVRSTVGLLENPVVQYRSDEELTCRICFDEFRRCQMHAVSCGHPFCSTCWKGYISSSISDGPGCLMLRCPEYLCGAAVGEDMINLMGDDEYKVKYSRYLLRSYVEYSRKTKWCPAPGCSYAVDFVVGSESYDVSCNCTNTFCWNCKEDAHRPVDCNTVGKWVVKNSAESENTNWILANSKPCPKCKQPIEKNQGCMHMTCTPPCNFNFCWLCLGSWSDHNEKTGGFYECNTYKKAKEEGTYNEDESRREMAKNLVERYTHYYERWASNQSSRQKAIVNLQQTKDVHIDNLTNKYCHKLSQGELTIITEAWMQIIECRRVLKWTYAYGYYLPEHEHSKRQFFEYVQGEAESELELLHKCVEKDLQVYLDADSPSEDFIAFRTKLAGLTNVCRKYFENLVRALENGLADVDAGRTCSQTGGGIDKTKKRRSGGAATGVAAREGI